MVAWISLYDGHEELVSKHILKIGPTDFASWIWRTEEEIKILRF